MGLMREQHTPPTSWRVMGLKAAGQVHIVVADLAATGVGPRAMAMVLLSSDHNLEVWRLGVIP